jgi:uncharacterized protein
MPTEQCNFRCRYCYEDFDLGEMPRAVVDSVKALLSRRVGQLDTISLEWFGGEPMLAFGLIEEIQGFALRLVADHPGVTLSGSMTTNGYLLRKERFLRLLDLGVTRYQISLDGTRDAHDRYRRRLGGGGSFDVIWKNLLAMRDLSETFQILLRLHATEDNLESLRQLIGDLALELGADPRFRVMIKAVRRFGGPNDGLIRVLDGHREEEVVGHLSRLAIDAGLLEARQGRSADESGLAGCYAAAANSFVVRSNGELAKCTVALRHSDNRVGRLHRDGTVELDSAKMTGWIRPALTGDAERIRCPLKGWVDAAPSPMPTRLPVLT